MLLSKETIQKSQFSNCSDTNLLIFEQNYEEYNTIPHTNA